jgi:hypothetical protein
MPKVEPTPDGREISIPSRQALLRNLNSKPEQHGEERLPRNDLSIEFTLKAKDAARIIDFEGDIESLWDDNGMPRFKELAEAIPLDFKARGIAKIGPARDESVSFDATLKKVGVLLSAEREVIVSAQVRIDPTGHTEMLTAAQCAGTIKFSFKGAVLVKAQADGEDDDDNVQLELGAARNGSDEGAEAPATH